MVLQEKVHVLLGTTGSNIMKIVNQVADKYKIISVCAYSSNDDLQDAANFTRYSFRRRSRPSRLDALWLIIMGRSERRRRNFTSCVRIILLGIILRIRSKMV